MFILLLLILLPGAVQAREFIAVGVTNGLEARVVPSLLVDRDGFLWVGSREGLFRFDGYETISYLPEPDQPGSISDSDISFVHQDESGTLWVGTYSGGLNRFNTATGRFDQFRHLSGQPDSLINDSVLAISDGPDGGLWVATQQGLSRLNRSAERFEHFHHSPDDAASLAVNWVNTLLLGPSKSLWVGTIGGGLQRWNPRSRSFTHFDLAQLTGGPAELNDVFALHESQNGALWIGTRVGLVRLDPTSGTAREMPLDRTGEFLPAVSSIAEDRSGRLWLGTLVHGILILDRASGARLDPPAGTRLPGPLRNQPQTSLLATQDMMFVGTWGGGVYRTSSHSTSFDLLSEETTEELRDDNITAVLATALPGRPWLGSQDSGPQRANVAARRVQGQQGFSDDLRKSRVLDIQRIAEDLYAAGTSRGLFTFTGAGVEQTRLSHDPGEPGSLAEGNVRALLPLASGDLLLGLENNGVYRMDAISGKLHRYAHRVDEKNSLSGDSVTALLSGPAGRVWVGTRSNGLNLCRLRDWTCTRFSARGEDPDGLSHHHVTALFRDRRGDVWVGTGGGGLNRVLRDGEGGVSGFERWTRRDGLLDDGIMAVQQDLDGSLWISTRHGLSRLYPETGRLINYVRESGLPASRFNTGAAASDAQYIYFGSVQGLLSLPKGSPFHERKPAKVGIASISQIAPGEKQRVSYWPERHLAIPYKEALSIKLAVLDLSESAHEYAYRLNSDEPWIDLGKQRQLMLHGLSPGRYQFQARGRDVFGYWGQTEPVLLEIVPPFWMTNGFRALVVAVLLLAAVAAMFLREAAQKRRAREIRRLSEQRERALEEQLGSAAELAVLTPRQKEVLQLIAEGKSTKEIADLLAISVKTVEAHRANLMDRLEIHDVPGLVRLAVRSRLVSQYE